MRSFIKQFNLGFYIGMSLKSCVISFLLMISFLQYDFRKIPAYILILPILLLSSPIFSLVDYIDYKLGYNAKVFYNAKNDSIPIFLINLLYFVFVGVSSIYHINHVNAINTAFLVFYTIVMPILLNLFNKD